MITREELVKKLESVNLPDIVLEDHQRELRASLLTEYATCRLSTRLSLPSWIQASMRSWKAITVTSLVWLVIALIVTLLVVIPAYQPSSTVLAIDAVMDNPQVKNILTGDEMESVTVTPIDSENLEVIVESHGGTIIIANVSVRNKVVTIREITYITIFGSIFEPEEPITGTEAEKVIGIASTNYEFRRLLDKGAEVDKIVAVQTVVSKRNPDTGETVANQQKWAMLTVSLQGKAWYFLVDPLGSRVINRSLEPVP